MNNKSTLFLAFLLTASMCLCAQNVPITEWTKSYGGADEDYAQEVEPTSDGGYIIAGTARSTDGDITNNLGNYDYWIVKVTETGSIEWQKNLGGSSTDIASSIKQTTDGGYIVAGYSYSTDGDVKGHHVGGGVTVDYWVVKLTSTGGIQWQKSLGGIYDDYAYAVQQTLDGGYIVAGNTKSYDGDVTFNNGHGYNDYWIVKLDEMGTLVWQKTLGGSREDYCTSIQQAGDGGYIACGYSYSLDSNVTGHHGTNQIPDYWVVKMNTSGDIEWQKSLGGTSSEYAYVVRVCTLNGYVVAGSSYSNDGNVTGHHGSTSINDFWVVRLGLDGQILWQRSLGGTAIEEARSIVESADSGFIIAGYGSSVNGDATNNYGAYDFWIVKIDKNGGVVWQKKFGGTSNDYAYSIKSVKKGGYIIAGKSDSKDTDVTDHHGTNLLYDYWLIKLGSEIVQEIYTFSGSGNWSDAAKWAQNKVPPSSIPIGSKIVIGSAPGDSCYLDIPVTVSTGASIIVSAGSNFIISGNLTLK